MSISHRVEIWSWEEVQAGAETLGMVSIWSLETNGSVGGDKEVEGLSSVWMLVQWGQACTGDWGRVAIEEGGEPGKHSGPEARVSRIKWMNHFVKMVPRGHVTWGLRPVHWIGYMKVIGNLDKSCCGAVVSTKGCHGRVCLIPGWGSCLLCQSHFTSCHSLATSAKKKMRLVFHNWSFFLDPI